MISISEKHVIWNHFVVYPVQHEEFFWMYIKCKFRFSCITFTSRTHLLWEHSPLQDLMCLFKRQHVKKITLREAGWKQGVAVVSVSLYLFLSVPTLAPVILCSPWNLCRHSGKKTLSPTKGRPHDICWSQPRHNQISAVFLFTTYMYLPSKTWSQISRTGYPSPVIDSISPVWCFRLPPQLSF